MGAVGAERVGGRRHAAPPGGAAATLRSPAPTPPASEGITSADETFVEGGEYTFTASGFEPEETGILVVAYSTPTVLATDATADALDFLRARALALPGAGDRERERGEQQPAAAAQAGIEASRQPPRQRAEQEEEGEPGAQHGERDPPQALDPAHPFPFIPNQGLSIVFDLERLSDKESVRELVMIPASLARFVRVPGDPARYIALEAVIRRFSADLFPGYRVRNSGVFRIIRDSDIEIEEEAEDLVRYFRSAIKRRRRGRVIRMEIEERIPEPVEEMLQDMLQGHEAVVVEVEGFIGIGDLAGIVDADRPDLKFEPYAPASPSGFANMAAIASPRSGRRTLSSTIPMKRSTWSLPF